LDAITGRARAGKPSVPTDDNALKEWRVAASSQPILIELRRTFSMAETMVLEATKRVQIGKEVRHLRAEGIIPGVLYGPTFDAINLQIEWVKLRPVLTEAGGSQIIKIDLDGETYNALVRQVQRAPMRGDVLHIDFYRVRMDVVIRTEVPIVLVGNADHLEDMGGVLIHEMNSVEVECLPGVLPSELRIDISGLQEVGDSILASALPELPGVSFHVSPDDVIVATTYLQRAEEGEEEEEKVLEESDEPELIRRRDEDEDDETEV
jgi:large subunit ribosomal protein L25